jgi:hypothetical protein
MVAKGQFPEVLLNEVKPKSVDPFPVEVFAALIRKSLRKDSSEPQIVFSDQFLPQMFTSRESSIPRCFMVSRVLKSFCWRSLGVQMVIHKADDFLGTWYVQIHKGRSTGAKKAKSSWSGSAWDSRYKYCKFQGKIHLTKTFFSIIWTETQSVFNYSKMREAKNHN